MNCTELTFRSSLPVPSAAALAWHDRPGAFERLTPPWMDVRIAAARGTTAPGDWKRLRVGAGPFGFDWTLVHQPLPEGTNAIGFLDEQRNGPFRAWRHEHRFVDAGRDNCVLEDRLAYRLPLGKLGNVVAGGRVKAQLADVFDFRHRRFQLDLSHHAAYRGAPLKIAVTGASGLVGQHLVAFLRAGGHSVYRLVRHAPAASGEIYWNPQVGEIDAAAMEGMDAVVHLAGESIASGRWTKDRKRRILASRVEGTRLLADTLARLKAPPSVFVSASATGYYGNRGEEFLTEASASGEGFLAAVCREWEAAALPATSAGIRVVWPRFGIVLAGNGGLLDRVTPLFRLGLGGRLGDGKQYLSWIALDDLLYVIHRAIVDRLLSGPINAVAPNPVTNRDFTATLARVLGRPAVLPAPASALRLALGGMADELLLTSQRALPARLTEVGFQFAFPVLEDALRQELGRVRGRHPRHGTPAAGREPSLLSGPAPADARDAA
jgi:uncharacterized protein (TIGR01777 family)